MHIDNEYNESFFSLIGIMQILILFIFFNYIFKKITVQFYVITNFHLIHLESIYNFTIFDKNDKCIYISHFSTLQKGKWDKNSLEFKLRY